MDSTAPAWHTAAILLARLIFAAIFLMATVFKFAGMADTAGYIAAAGFPFPLFLAWVAAIFEALLVICFLTGAFFTEAALLAAIYVVFLAFASTDHRIGKATSSSSAPSSTTSPSWPGCCLPQCMGQATCWPCARRLLGSRRSAESDRGLAVHCELSRISIPPLRHRFAAPPLPHIVGERKGAWVDGLAPFLSPTKWGRGGTAKR